MKAGTENKAKVYAAVVLAIVAVLTVAWALLPGGGTGTQAPPVITPTAKAKIEPAESLDPRLNMELLANSENVKYEGKGKNIFRANAEVVAIPKPVKSPMMPNRTDPTKADYVPPPPPPINLKYFGTTNSKGEKPRAFLSQGDAVWIANEGDVVNRHYKIVRISPREVEVEDLLNNHRESIPLTQG